jgi:hypothetical protein
MILSPYLCGYNLELNRMKLYQFGHFSGYQVGHFSGYQVVIISQV